MPKPLTVWITINCGKFLKWSEYQTTLCDTWEICMQVKKQQLEPDMEQWTGSKLGKEYVKPVYCCPAYLNYMQSISCKMPGWMMHRLESRLPGEISITSDMQMTPHCWGPEWGTPPLAKVMRKEAQHTQRWDWASGVPLEILEHLPS